MSITKHTYPDTHPQKLLLSRHKRIIPSRITQPNGKSRVTFRIKPSKVTLAKWFFQEHLADTGLCMIQAAACSLPYAHIGSESQNQIINVFGLNTALYKFGDWGAAQTNYKPYDNPPQIIQYKTAGITAPQTFTLPVTYAQAVDYNTGWFNSKWLQATSITTPEALALPILAFSYNAQIDDGEGNNVWFKSTLVKNYDQPKSDLDMIISNMPIWQCLYGYTDFIRVVKPDPNLLDSYVILIQSKYVLPFSGHGTGNYWMPIDANFVKGNNPYGAPVYSEQKKKWFPRVKHQQETINAFVKSGPYIPRYENQRKSTWELHAFYTFYLKLGGTFTEEEAVVDPKKQGDYITPTMLKETIQVINPIKQKARHMLHSWDWRRGLITKSALKRILQDPETDTDFQTDADPVQPPKKKKKTTKVLSYPPKEKEDLQAALLSLCEESTYQEPQTPQQLQQLILQQQQQQTDLKFNILRIISDLKEQQRVLQLQTGIIN